MNDHADQKMWITLKENLHNINDNHLQKEEKLSFEDEIKFIIKYNDKDKFVKLINNDKQLFLDKVKGNFDLTLDLCTKSSLELLDEFLKIVPNEKYLYQNNSLYYLEDELLQNSDIERLKIFLENNIYPIEDELEKLTKENGFYNDIESKKIRKWIIGKALWKYPKCLEYFEDKWVDFGKYITKDAVIPYLSDEYNKGDLDSNWVLDLYKKENVIHKIKDMLFDNHHHVVYKNITNTFYNKNNIDLLWHSAENFNYVKMLLENSLFPNNSFKRQSWFLRGESWTNNLLCKDLKKEEISKIFKLFMTSQEQKDMFLKEMDDYQKWEYFIDCPIINEVIDFLINADVDVINKKNNEGNTLLHSLWDISSDIIISDTVDNYLKENLEWTIKNKETLFIFREERKLIKNNKEQSISAYLASLERLYIKNKINYDDKKRELKDVKKIKM